MGLPLDDLDEGAEHAGANLQRAIKAAAAWEKLSYASVEDATRKTGEEVAKVKALQDPWLQDEDTLLLSFEMRMDRARKVVEEGRKAFESAWAMRTTTTTPSTTTTTAPATTMTGPTVATSFLDPLPSSTTTTLATTTSFVWGQNPAPGS